MFLADNFYSKCMFIKNELKCISINGHIIRMGEISIRVYITSPSQCKTLKDHQFDHPFSLWTQAYVWFLHPLHVYQYRCSLLSTSICGQVSSIVTEAQRLSLISDSPKKQHLCCGRLYTGLSQGFPTILHASMLRPRDIK